MKSETDNELRTLIEATGLTYPQLAERFGAHPKTIMGWYTGKRPPALPKLVKCALQLIVLEQCGVITTKLVEQAVSKPSISQTNKQRG